MLVKPSLCGNAAFLARPAYQRAGVALIVEGVQVRLQGVGR
jgi:hypothetical protein